MSYILISGNIVKNVPYAGILLGQSRNSVTNSNIEFNSLTNCTNGIYLENGTNNDVYGNVFSECNTNFYNGGSGTSTSQPSIVALIVTSSPRGVDFVTVNGIAGYAGSSSMAPYTFYATVDGSVTIAANSPVGGYVFQSWSDSGAQFHSITVPSTDQIYTATYTARALVPPVSMESNVTITNETIRSTLMYFTVSGTTGQTGYVNATMPIGFNSTDIKVFIDTQPVQPPFPIITTNGTHYFIYFKFTLSTHRVTILFTRIGDLGSRVEVSPGVYTNEFGVFDGLVNAADLSLFLQCYHGTAPAAYMSLGDLGSRININGTWTNVFFAFDGVVNGVDLQLLLQCYRGLGP
jgi:hypothetical protein